MHNVADVFELRQVVNLNAEKKQEKLTSTTAYYPSHTDTSQ